ncbi:MAG: hypothetical protein E7285_02160 [Lachnospiraceae bacterium]|nr:hypothetical protein [Lachnospiraceae bacterium]
MFICLYLPLFLASLCLLFREEKNILNLQFKKTKYLDFFILNICNVFASGFGYIINLKILAKQYKFTDFTFLRWSYIREQSIIDIINTWLENFGYVANVNLLGHRALRHNIFCFLIIILIILAVFYGIRNTEKKYNFLALFYCAAIFVTTALFTFSEMGITGRYIYPFAFIFVILLACGFERFEKKIKYLLLFFVQLFAIICIVFINDYSLYSEGYNKEVEKEIVDFLTERDLLQGYAMGENLTYYSNGEIEVWRLEECQEENESRYLQVRPFLQSITHTQQLPEGETFFVLEKSSYEENRMYRELIDVGQKAFENDRYIVFLYDTAEELVEDLEIR